MSDCSATGTILRITSIPEGVCIRVGGESVLGSIAADGTLGYQMFPNSQCIASVYAYWLTNGTCTLTTNLEYSHSQVYIKALWTYGPQIPVPSYVSAHVATSCSQPTDPDKTMTTLQFPGQCLFSELNYNFRTMFTTYPGLTLTLSPDCGAGVINFDNSACGTLYQQLNIVGMVVNNPFYLSISVSNLAYNSYNTITGTISYNGIWHVPVTYNVYYYSQSASAWVYSNYINNATLGSFVTGQLENQTSIMVKVEVAGIDFTNQVTIPTYTSSALQMPITPIMQSLSSVSKTAETVTFTYKSYGGLFGSPAVFAITVNDQVITDPNCITDVACQTITTSCQNSSATCTVRGLPLGGVANISVSSSSNGATSAPMTLRVQLYPELVVKVSSYSYTSNSITINYGVTGGTPGADVYYDLYHNSTAVANCQETTNTRCVISGLTSINVYQILIIAHDAEQSQTATTYIKVWNDIQGVEIESNITTTKSIQIFYDSTGGDPDLTLYYIYLNSAVVQNAYKGTNYTFTDLTPGTVYTVSVQAMNNGISRIFNQGFETFSNVEPPSIDIISKNYYSVAISFESTQGVPFGTTYTVTNMGINVFGCINIRETQCNVTNLSPNTQYNFQVFAINDGHTTDASSDSYSTSTPPSVINFDIDFHTTNSVEFEYDSNFGVDNQQTIFTIIVGGHTVTDASCTAGTSCSVSGLTPGSNTSISIQASNYGLSGPIFNGYVVLYDSVTAPEITQSDAATTSISLEFSSDKGVPGETRYTVKVDGVEYADCANLITGECEITDLQDGTAYQIQVIASNDGLNQTTTQTISTYPFINSPTITAKPRITDMIVSYSVQGGAPSITMYSVSIDGLPKCDTADTFCSLSGLDSDTEYNVSITATNDVHSISFFKMISTYSTISAPTIDSEQTTSDKKFTLKFDAENGIPDEKYFSVSMNGTEVTGCQNISTKTCVIPDVPLHANVTFNVTVTNDVYAESTEKTIETYDYLTKPTITIAEANVTLISISWTASNGGKDGLTKYSAFISNGASYTEKCSNVTTTTCLFDGLTADTQYGIRVVSTNPVFTDSLASDTTSTTAKPSNDLSNSNQISSNILIVLLSPIIISLFI